jgi:hypothetical protein
VTGPGSRRISWATGAFIGSGLGNGFLLARERHADQQADHHAADRQHQHGLAAADVDAVARVHGRQRQREPVAAAETAALAHDRRQRRHAGHHRQVEGEGGDVLQRAEEAVLVDEGEGQRDDDQRERQRPGLGEAR